MLCIDLRVLERVIELLSGVAAGGSWRGRIRTGHRGGLSCLLWPCVLQVDGGHLSHPAKAAGPPPAHWWPCSQGQDPSSPLGVRGPPLSPSPRDRGRGVGRCTCFSTSCVVGMGGCRTPRLRGAGSGTLPTAWGSQLPPGLREVQGQWGEEPDKTSKGGSGITPSALSLGSRKPGFLFLGFRLLAPPKGAWGPKPGAIRSVQGVVVRRSECHPRPLHPVVVWGGG